MKFIFLMFLVYSIFLMGCDKSKENKRCSMPILGVGNWTFIEINDSIIDYAEIYFKDGNTFTILSETNGRVGPFSYLFLGDTFIFNNLKFKVISDSSGMLKMKHGNDEFILYKIPFNVNDLDSNQINPFCLRRCYFWVHMKIINMNDATQYLLHAKGFFKDSLPEEEIIPLN